MKLASFMPMEGPNFSSSQVGHNHLDIVGVGMHSWGLDELVAFTMKRNFADTIARAFRKEGFR
jgi:hypothetical protein